MADLKISQAGLDFIKGFESFVPYVYDDLRPPIKGKYREWQGEPVRGTLTIGYGHTDDAKHPLKIKQGLRITEAEACEILDVDLDDCEEAVRKQVKVPITQGQFDALVSFTFNCGAGHLKALTERINAGKMAEARTAFRYYDKSKGKTLNGLVRRRQGEQALWDMVPPPEITVADTFHPAEVEKRDVTAKDLVVDGSRSMTTLQWIKALLGLGGATTVGLTSADNTSLSWFEWVRTALFGPGEATAILSPDGIARTKGYIHEIKTLLSDHASLLVLGGLVAGYLLAHLVQVYLLKAANDGRYVPDVGPKEAGGQHGISV